MIKLMKNTFKVLIKKRSYIILAIILPVFLLIFFSFEFGEEYNFKIGVIDKDNSYTSQEIIKTIEELEDIDTVILTDDDYKIKLITQQVELVIIIGENFQNNILNLKDTNLIIKSISESDIKATIESVLNLRLEDLATISKLSNGDIDKFKQLNTDYEDIPTQLSLNDIKEERPGIGNSMGLVILMIFIIGGNISNYLLEDEANHTKIRILSSGIGEVKYYISMIIVFYIMSAMTSILYYFGCEILNVNFNMDNEIDFLIILLTLNFLAIGLNLFIISFCNSRYTFNIVNILIIVPSCMISGVFWDFEIMPTYLQKIGSFIPIRWAYICIENLQNNMYLKDISIYIYLMIFISIILLIMSIINFKYRRKIKL